MKKFLGTVLFGIYVIIAIAITVLLLSYNDYNCSELGGYTLYIVKDDSLEPTYKKGELLIIEKSSLKNIAEGDNVLLYNIISSSEYSVILYIRKSDKNFKPLSFHVRSLRFLSDF